MRRPLNGLSRAKAMHKVDSPLSIASRSRSVSHRDSQKRSPESRAVMKLSRKADAACGADAAAQNGVDGATLRPGSVLQLTLPFCPVREQSFSQLVQSGQSGCASPNAIICRSAAWAGSRTLETGG